MERPEALALLESSESHQRLQAARVLVEVAEVEDRGALEKALREEPDAWTKAALRRALRRTVPPMLLVAEAPADNQDGAEHLDIYGKAVEETTARLVHELRRLVGQVKLAGRREFPSWEGSNTRAAIARLDSLMEAVDRLGRAAGVPAIEEFDLGDLVSELVRVESEQGAQIELIGRRPLIVTGDPFLVDVALQNGLRNASEAVEESGSPEPVIVSWGDTDRDFWVTVADRGPGLPPRADLFQLGATTKGVEHSGVGLALARQAIQSLGGSLTLTGREDGGVSFEMRWFR